MVVVMTWISLQHLVSRNKIMSNYLATFQEPDFLVDEVCVYILSHILDIGIGVLTKSGVWTTSLADNMSKCEKYFAYCGPGIFIPIKHIQPGEEKILEERYLKTKEKAPKKGGKGGKGGKGSLELRKKRTRLNPLPKLLKQIPLQHLSHQILVLRKKRTRPNPLPKQIPLQHFSHQELDQGPSRQRKL